MTSTSAIFPARDAPDATTDPLGHLPITSVGIILDKPDTEMVISDMKMKKWS